MNLIPFLLVKLLSLVSNYYPAMSKLRYLLFTAMCVFKILSSYTDNDVRILICHTSNIWNQMYPGFEAVSYTHLDVYKRQIPFLCKT